MSRATLRGRLTFCTAATLALLASLATAPASAASTVQLYQHAFDLTCTPIQCKVVLPKVVAKTRLNIHRVSCYLYSNLSGRVGILQFTPTGGNPMAQYLPATKLSSNETIFNQKMDILIGPQMSAEIRLTSNGDTLSGNCTLTGRLLKDS